MQYVWDQAKDVLNRRKHAMRLAEGIQALEDPDRESWIDNRFDYGEERIITMGRNEQAVLVVVSTESIIQEEGYEVTRIISVREANRKETEWFCFGRA